MLEDRPSEMQENTQGNLDYEFLFNMLYQGVIMLIRRGGLVVK